MSTETPPNGKPKSAVVNLNAAEIKLSGTLFPVPVSLSSGSKHEFELPDLLKIPGGVTLNINLPGPDPSFISLTITEKEVATPTEEWQSMYIAGWQTDFMLMANLVSVFHDSDDENTINKIECTFR